MGDQMRHTAVRLPQEMIRQLDTVIAAINGADEHGRILTRSMYIRRLLGNELDRFCAVWRARQRAGDALAANQVHGGEGGEDNG